MKQLVIAEKPSVGRDIARVLNCAKKSNTYMEGDKYIVTWALGHLVTLADPEAYGKQYKEWNMDTLPMIPKEWELVIINQTKGQYRTVKELIYRKDVDRIIIATDAGREGELVARWILDKAGSKKPIQRLWISSVTDKAIRDGFAALKPGKAYENLYHAAVARAEADWLVGINATRALTCKYNAQLSCGRVQTPTLGMIAKREDTIRSFVPQTYYGLQVQAGQTRFTWQQAKTGNSKTFEKVQRDQVAQRMEHGTLVIESVEKKKKKSYAPLLYNLTDLQSDANKRFGFSAKQTLNILQGLYEQHKVLTYPRTDSRHLTSDMEETLKERLKACGVGPYSKLAGKLIMKPLKPGKNVIDDSKVSDHHALIPTEQFVQLMDMDQEERKIYDMVIRRFLAVLYPPCEYEETKITGKIGQDTCTAKGIHMLTPGYREVFETEADEPDSDTVHIAKAMVSGEVYPVERLSLTEGKTKPPSRYTEGTLIAEMEKQGLGTVATRADIIEKLFRSFLMQKEEKEIQITSKGKQLMSLVPGDLKSPELTSDWENRLTAIAEGKQKQQAFMADIRNYTQALILEIKNADGTFRHDNVTRQKCPNCGKYLLSVNGKNAKMLVCQDRECGYRETVSRTSNARCPVCHKKMQLIGKGEEQKFVCACGHKEKLSAFQERRKKEGGGVSKKDVQNYLNKQKKEAEEPLNNAFAEALSKLKR